MAQHGNPETRRGAAMVGVAVPQHDPLQSSQLGRGRGRPLRHRLGAGVELDHASVVLDEVDVHPSPQVAGVSPHAVRDALCGGGHRVQRHRA
jgi:hypothetical protein